MDTFEKKYPQAMKVTEVKERSQACGEFLDWLKNTKGLTLAKWHMNHQHDDSCSPDGHYQLCELYEGQDELRLDHTSVYDLLAEFFDIDLNAYEKEKQQMLDELRAQRGKEWLYGEIKEEKS